ncbi:RluA family pseudouridine synthase [Candidatus Gracilibacteria bacterium]|nr:RluA family pseudouridine synthase [Candidatus Gracilibacteria bacterium]
MKEYIIEENDADQRLDRFLKKLFPNALKSLIYKFNRKNKIKILGVNGKKTKQDNEYKLQVGEVVQVYLSDSEIGELSQPISISSFIKKGEYENLSKKDIVFEDNHLLVINKNPGINVHPGEHKTQEVSLIQQVDDYFKYQKLSSLTFKPSLIHRIDRDTSGIIMIAKDKASLVRLAADFKNKKALQKTYYAIVLGKLSRSEGTIKKNLLRIENAKNENKVQVSEKGQEAITHYKVLEEYRLQLPEGEQIISALEIVIETGRMHQIRVHLAHIGNPILGDKAYGDKRLNGYFAKNYSVTRQMLHAWKIVFTHPKTLKKMNLTARLKEDMEKFVSKIS